MNSATIYQLTLPDGRFYVGSTLLPLQKRLKLHRDKAYRSAPSQKVHKAIRSDWLFGSLAIDAISVVPVEARFEFERELTAAAKALHPDLCLNEFEGSKLSEAAIEKTSLKNTGKRASDSTKALMSEQRLGNKFAVGLVHSEEFRARQQKNANKRARISGRFA